MAVFRISQASAGTGNAGEARHDLVPGEVIQLEVVSPTGVGVTYAWEIIDKANSTAVLSSTTAANPTIGIAGLIDEPCSFEIKLTATDNGVVTTVTRIASVRSPNANLRIPMFAETAPRAHTLLSNDPDDSIDNAQYPDLTGLGTATKNWRAWAEWAYEITMAVDAGFGVGGPPSGSASGDLAGTYPAPTVDGLQGVPVSGSSPLLNDVLTFNGSAWEPQPLPGGAATLQDAYDGDNAITISAGNPFVVQSGAATDVLVQLIRTNTGAGCGLTLDFGANATGCGIDITHTNAGHNPSIDITHMPGQPSISMADGTNTFTLAADRAVGPLGTPAAPTYTFAGNTTTGLSLDTTPTPQLVFSLASDPVLTIAGTLNQATGDEVGLSYETTINKATSGDYVAVRINATEISAPGNGNKLLVLAVGDSVVASFDTTGNLVLAGAGAVVTSPNGTASAPSSNFAGSSNTGLYLADTDPPTLGIAVEGGAALTITRLLDAATGNEVAYDLATTVDKATSGDYTAFRLNVTETTVPDDGYLMRLQVNTGDQIQMLNNGRIRIDTGSAFVPSYSFINAPTLGMIAVNTNTVAFAAEGGVVLSAMREVNEATGDEVAVSITPEINKATSGDYVALGIDATETAAPGTSNKLIRARSGAGGATEVFSVLATGGIIATDGTSGSPTYSFISAPANGMYAPATDQVALRVNGAEILLDNTGANPFLQPDVTATWDVGSATYAIRRMYLSDEVYVGGNASLAKGNVTTSAPGVGNDNTEGYAIKSRWLDTTGGKEYVATSVATGAAVWVELGGGGLWADGTVGSPSAAFASDTNTGFWWDTADQINISCGGVERWNITTTSLLAQADTTNFIGSATLRMKQIFAGPGTAALPAVSVGFGTTDGDNGLFAAATDTISVSIAGTEEYVFKAAAFEPFADNANALGAATKRFTTLYSTTLNTGDIHLHGQFDDAHWTINESRDGIFVHDRKTGEVFRLLMERVGADVAPPPVDNGN